jgi:L,D-transpeptidase ErfK/SrfK
VILHRGDSLLIPDSALVNKISNKLKTTTLDLNIPEFKLRLLQEGDTILVSTVRVGKNKEEYLSLAGHTVDLRTPIGQGEIIRIERNPYYINPDDGKRYDSTRRDDGQYTKMPIIPWLEPTINGIRYGDMIHATTNINTLGKASSHGCIGTSESDAWVIYYNSPLGTKVTFRYDLILKGNHNDTIQLKDIYFLKTRLK